MGRTRCDLPEPFSGYPAFGAYHTVTPNRSLGRYLGSFCEAADEVFLSSLGSEEIKLHDEIGEAMEAGEQFDAIEIVPPRGSPKEFDRDNFYIPYSLTGMWAGVLDGNQSEKHARRIRKIWEGHDLGDTEQMARNEVDKILPAGGLPLVLGQVARIGSRLPNAPNHHEGRKLALVPNPGECTETQSHLAEAREIVVGIIQQRMEDFAPEGEYIPHVTFAWFKDGVDEDELSTIAKRAQELAAAKPVRVNLDPALRFHDRLVRDTK